MDSSTSRVLLAVVACVGILIAWEFFVVRGRRGESPGRVAAERAAGSERAAEDKPRDEGRVEVAPAGKKRRGEKRLATTTRGEGTSLRWPAGQARLTFNDRGAVLQSAVLLNERFKERRDGRLQQVDLVQTEGQQGPWPLRIGFPRSDFEFPENAKFELAERSERSVRYVWTSDAVKVFKHYVLDPQRPLLWLTVGVANRSGEALRQRLEVELFSRQVGNEKASITNPYPKLPTGLCHVNGQLERRSVESVRGGDSGCGPGGCGIGSGPLAAVGTVRWIATDDRYFMIGLVPRGKESEQLRCTIRPRDEDAQVLEVALVYPEQRLKVGEVWQEKFGIFLGPKDLERLDAVKGAGEKDARLGEAIEFGWFSFLSRPMLALLKVFEAATGNWGLAIILLTVFVKVLTLYWSTKSMRSMRQMQRLKPKIDELRERYKDDKQRMNQEMMALYKVHRVSPLGGCLPMLIQMPVWFALYSTLGNAQELYRSGFFGWVTDLTASDPYYVWPIAVGLAMFAQQAISPQPMEGAQAKMMKYFMPGMFSVFMMWLPAGLTIYILVNTVLTMVHQWYINRTDPIPASAGDGATAGRSESAKQAVQKREGTAPRGASESAKRKRRRKKTS